MWTRQLSVFTEIRVSWMGVITALSIRCTHPVARSNQQLAAKLAECKVYFVETIRRLSHAGSLRPIRLPGGGWEIESVKAGAGDVAPQAWKGANRGPRRYGGTKYAIVAC
jgi:hypothetical protein